MPIPTPPAHISHVKPTHSQVIDVDDVFSARAKRRLVALLKLRLLELQEAHLERVRAVIEHRLELRDLFEDDERNVKP